MYSHKRIMRILDGLKEHGALMCAVWGSTGYPRIWLEEWCRTRCSVSVGTAEQILEEIVAGKLRPSEGLAEPYRTHHPRHRRTREPEYIETSFVEYAEYGYE